MSLSATEYKELAISIMEAAYRAGAAILEVYGSAPVARYKEDNSPVTDADQASEAILISELSNLMSGVPVVAEERTASGYVPDLAESFFLVDPLDGTKEFLKFNGEFAINIALVKHGMPVFGLIYGPAQGDCYVTLNPGNAYRCKIASGASQFSPHDVTFVALNGEAPSGRPFTAIVSRSHPKPEALAFLEKLGNPPRALLGSSLKFGVLARGHADVYPRFGPTAEWDTAAGQAILEAVGGSIVTLDGNRLRYGNRASGFINPPFIAWRRPSAAAQLLTRAEVKI